MSLLHIGVALCLSAAAAFLVTGATMRSIQPDCMASSRPVHGEPGCLPADGGKDAAAPGSSVDAGKQNAGRRAFADD
jgi:hypothetical protein